MYHLLLCLLLHSTGATLRSMLQLHYVPAPLLDYCGTCFHMRREVSCGGHHARCDAPYFHRLDPAVHFLHLQFVSLRLLQVCTVWVSLALHPILGTVLCSVGLMLSSTLLSRLYICTSIPRVFPITSTFNTSPCASYCTCSTLMRNTTLCNCFTFCCACSLSGMHGCMLALLSGQCSSNTMCQLLYCTSTCVLLILPHVCYSLHTAHLHKALASRTIFCTFLAALPVLFFCNISLAVALGPSQASHTTIPVLPSALGPVGTHYLPHLLLTAQ
jgi:hypothetical protein